MSRKRARPWMGAAAAAVVGAAWCASAVGAQGTGGRTTGAPGAPLVYSVTLRDFLPSICMPAAEYPGHSAGPSPGEPNPDDATWGLTEGKTNGCPLVDEIMQNGTVSGHPDFEIRFGAFGVTGFGWNESGPIESQSADEMPVSSIIDRSGFDYDTSGLPKPRYCSATERCGGNAFGDWITTGSEYFSNWFRDDPKYNRRSGLLLEVPNVGMDLFKFDSLVDGETQLERESEEGPDGFFGPLDNAKGWVWPELNASAWSILGYEENPGHRFWFTTEIHTWFEFRGDEFFEFSGDDDVWVFINGRLAVDLGGVHWRAKTNVSLKQEQERLGLVVGEIYEFDLFHAERHTVESNFKLSTTLRASCNVIQSGTVSLELQGSSESDLGTGPARGALDSSGALLITSPQDTYTSTHAFFLQQHNVGSGFVLDFEIEVSSVGRGGFALVLHRRPQGLRNMPMGPGPHMGLRYLSHSIAVIFDLCADGAPACSEQQVRLHYNRNGPEEYNEAGPATRRVYDRILQPLGTGLTHRVRVQYLERPDWLEVYLDDSLYLRKRDFNLTQIIGGRNAFVGFTAGTLASPATQRVTSLTLRTVQIDPLGTQFVQDPATDGVADGTLESGAAVTIRNYDACVNPIQFGGAATRAGGVFVRTTPDASAKPPPGSVQGMRGLQDTDGDRVVPAQVVDNGDGTYGIVLVTTTIAEFEGYAVFGEGCSVVVDEATGQVTVVQNSDNSCWFSKSPGTVRMVEPPPTPAVPTWAPAGPPVTPPSNHEKLVRTLGGGGGLILVLLFLCLLMCWWKRKWDRDKAFVAHARSMQALSDDADAEEKAKLAAKRQRARASILRARARKETEQRQLEVAALTTENVDLKFQLRLEKVRKQRDAAMPMGKNFHDISGPKKKKLFRPVDTGLDNEADSDADEEARSEAHKAYHRTQVYGDIIPPPPRSKASPPPPPGEDEPPPPPFEP